MKEYCRFYDYERNHRCQDCPHPTDDENDEKTDAEMSVKIWDKVSEKLYGGIYVNGKKIETL